MITKIFALIALVGVAGICVSQALSPSPAESPSPSQTPAKHRAMKKATATPRPATHPAPSPSPNKFSLGDLFKPKSSGAAVSPAPAKGTNAKATTKAPAPGGGHGKVWVNSETHVYHKEGSPFYGTTKQGKYMTEADAIKQGNKAAQH
ncbi:MAG: signal protein [Candidatus Udaeobacter sp.]